MRATGSVGVLHGRVNAEMGIRSREDVLHDLGIVLRLGSMLVGRADDLASMYSASSDRHAEDSRPVVPSGGGIHSRSAAHLAPSDHQRGCQFAATFEVFEQG